VPRNAEFYADSKSVDKIEKSTTKKLLLKTFASFKKTFASFKKLFIGSLLSLWIWNQRKILGF